MANDNPAEDGQARRKKQLSCEEKCFVEAKQTDCRDRGDNDSEAENKKIYTHDKQLTYF